jgi:hypothetical protein
LLNLGPTIITVSLEIYMLQGNLRNTVRNSPVYMTLFPRTVAAITVSFLLCCVVLWFPISTHKSLGIYYGPKIFAN